jgi:hypothetical protein
LALCIGEDSIMEHAYEVPRTYLPTYLNGVL